MWVIMLLLKIILYMLGALLLILMTLLVVPFSYSGEAELSNGVSFNYKLGWFWNLFNLRGTRRGDILTTEAFLGNRRIFTVNTKEEEASEESGEEEVKKERSSSKKNYLQDMFDTKLIKEALSYLKRILLQISPKHIQLKGSFGFDDPSITGMLAGFIYTIQGIYPQSRINIEPCFTEEVLDLELKAAGSVSAGRLAWDTARFLLKKDVRAKIFKKGRK